MADAEYRALCEKVDGFAAEVAARADLTCHAGCDGCCEVQLEVCEVEADALAEAIRRLPGERRRALRDRPPGAGCVLRGGDGRCEVYDARPLVCRTQGLPLRYPAGTIPARAVMGRAGTRTYTWCPLNFTVRRPDPEDVLDAERVDVMLALINRRVAGDARALVRRSIRDVVEETTR